MIRRGTDTDTPMMQQYFRAREQHPDAVLFFRMGDFYEMFFDDAEYAAGALGITLTSRSKDRSGTRVPMAGVPVKAAPGYIRRLVDAGRNVAICEQVEDPAESKGIVERRVVQVVTPGTFLDEDRLADASALHLVALAPVDNGLGIAWVDLSTGRFHAADLTTSAECEAQLLRIAPAECLLPDGLRREQLPVLTWLAENFPRCAVNGIPEWHFDRSTGRERLLGHFRTRTLEGFGCEHLTAGLGAAGALLHYLEETQQQSLSHITALTPTSTSGRLRLDAATLRALDLVEVARTGERRGSLLGAIDHTATPMGARLIREWLLAPLLDRTEILARQGAVVALHSDPELAAGLRTALKGVRDVERLTSRLPFGRLNGRDLRALARSLRAVPDLRAPLEPLESPLLAGVRTALEPERLTEMATEIEAAVVEEPPVTITDGGVIRDGHDADLDEMRAVSREGIDWIARFQAEEIERSGIPSLKVGYNRVFGYYIEVTHTHRDRIPDDYTRKQTLKNAERYITPALKEQEHRVLGARDRAVALEQELFATLRARLAEDIPLLQRCAGAVAELDVLLALAEAARAGDHVAPEVVEEPVLDIVGGRHPVLATRDSLGEEFVPNDVRLGGEHGTLAVITGPNMAGKSTYIRQAAVLTILAQVGALVPAERARIGIADRVFTRVGAADELSRGQSTFMVEMTETASILNNASERSLVILDEVGRGTSTLDGISLAWAIAEHLVEQSAARTLFATHYHELTELGTRFTGRVQNLNVAVQEWRDEIVFLHKIVPGATDKAYGIHVARLAGIPSAVLDRARDILAFLEAEHLHGRESPLAVPEPDAEDGSRQLDLFGGQAPGGPPNGSRSPEVAERLATVDLDRTTPLEALAILAELKKLL